MNNWIENFSDEDKPTAEQLFNSIQFFTLSDLEKELHLMLRKINTQINYAVYPLTDKKYFRDDIDFLDLFRERKLLFERDDGNLKNDADSEYMIMNFIRNFCQETQGLINMPNRSEFKKFRIRGILILTDLIASGKQISDLLSYLLSDPTVRSYTSFNLIKDITIISHLCTEMGKKAVLARKIYSKDWKVRPIYARHARTINDFYSDLKERQKIIDLCYKYAINKSKYLGFGEIGLVSVYEHKIPNNVPGILIQKGKNWTPLFDNRRRSERTDDDSIKVPDSIHLIQDVLLLARKTRRNLTERISERLRVSMVQAEELKQTIQTAGYLSEKNTMTLLGSRLLKKIEKRKVGFNESDDYLKEKYYPFYKGHKS